MKEAIFNLFLRSSGRNVSREYAYLKQREYASLSENMELQEVRLREILKYAYENVPYYRFLFSDFKLFDNGKLYFDRFSQVPALTKDLLRKNFSDLKSRDPLYSRRKPYVNTTSGSTGEPVEFIQDREFWTKYMASKWLFYSFIKDYPCRHIKFWGSERDILKGGHGFSGSLKNWLFQRKFLNTFRMSEKEMFDYVREINSYRPVFIEAYVEAMYEFSQFVIGNKLSVFSPEGIIVSAETLYPHIKETISKAFNCQVLNRYGAREVGDVACSCSENNGLHVNICDYYLEVLDDEMRPVQPGENGAVHITSLNNFSMPLVKYRIGDLAVLSEQEGCSCGRGLPLIREIKGRDSEFFFKNEYDRVHGAYFVFTLYHRSWVKKYQIIQKSYNSITYRIVKHDDIKLDKKELDEIRSLVRQVMGDQCQVDFEFTGQIETTDNGKFLYLINEMKK